MAGRKSKWDELEMENKLILVEGWARDGMTDKDIMANLGISHNLFYQWKREKNEFNDALKKGKEVIDRQVENALLESALGFHYREQTVTNQGEVVELKKYEKPNTTAQIFWLKNRKPGVWRDKQEVQHDGNIELVFEDDYGDD